MRPKAKSRESKVAHSKLGFRPYGLTILDLNDEGSEYENC